MDYFAEVSDEFSAEISSSNEEQMESSDYRSSVSLHHKIAEKPKSKRIIRIGRRTTNGSLSSTKINGSLSSSKINGSLSSSQISGCLSSTKINGSLSSSKLNGSLSSNQNNSSLSINLNIGTLSSNQINDSLSSYQNDGSPSLNQNNSSLSLNQNNGSRNYDVPELPVANATPHQARTRLLKLINTVDTETREKIRKKSASMVADLQLRKKLESKLNLKNQENPITASRDSRLANITKESDRHSDCVARPETARRSLVTPLDNFSPRPVMRREQQERSVADVDPTDSGLGLEEACSPLSSSRAISGAEPGPAGRVVEFRPPCDIRGVKDKKKITLESIVAEKNKVVDKLARKKGRKTPIVVDDAFELEEETPTSLKEPPIPVNNEKRGVKRYNVSEKLDTHVGKLDEKDVDDNTRCDEEPPKKKLSPDNKTKRKPYKQCDVYEPTTTNYAEDETESTEVNFKKPLLLLPKSKPRSKKGEELCSSQEEKLEGEPVSDSIEHSWNIEEAKRSDSPKVDENREAEVPQKELIEKRYLNKWVPFLRNKKLYIEGYLINFDSIAPSDMSTKWTTSKIVSRISDKQVGTKKTCYVLEGQLAIPAPGERPVPLFVIDKFRNGFPENWKNIIEHWIHLNNQSLVTEVTNQTILNNISTISMTLFNSTPMPGMMSNMNVTNVSCIPNVYPSSNEIARDPSPSRVVEEPSPSRVVEEPSPSGVVEEPSPSRVLEEPSPSRVLEESPSSRVFDDPVHSMVVKEPVHLRVSSLERCSEVNTQDHEKVSGEGGSDGKEEQSESKQETELPLDQEKYQRKSRSKVVRKSANRSTKNKPAESQHTDNLASSDKNEASSASTVIVDGKIKYPCEHCDYVGLQLRYLNTHKRKHKNLKTGRSHSNSKVVKPDKIVPVGSTTRSLSESSVADMALREEQVIVNKPTSQEDNHEKIIVKTGSQAENTSDAENLTEKTEPIISNKTMTLRDFAKLTHARNYPNTKMVLRQKFYLCQFCDFQCTVFKQLKDHLKSFHVDNENNEPDNSSKNLSSISQQTKPRLKSSSPNPLKSKHRSRSPVKRKVKSKSSRDPSPEELFPAGHGQQETGAKKSRFGRKLVQNTSFTRTSWIDFSHTTDVYEPMATKAKKQGSMVQSEQKEPIFKKKSKAARTVKNPFRMDGAGDIVTVNPNNKEHVQSIKADPKTVRDRIRNSAILKEFSVDHEDDMFRSSSKLDPKGDTVSLGRLGTLDDSQSDNDISLHSSQTQVTKYNSNLASVAWGNGVTTPSLRLVKTPSGRSDIQQSGFEREAFIHRKVVENKKQAKDKNKKRLKCVLATDQAGSQLQSDVEKSQLESEVEQSTRIIKNVTAMTGEPDVEDEEGAGDNYFDDTQSVQFFCDPNPALMKLFKQRESRKNNQKFK